MRDAASEAARAWIAATLAGDPGPLRTAWRTAAIPASRLYALAAARARDQCRRRAQPMSGVVVVSVGGLTLGGAGKTPCAAWVAGLLREWGLMPAVISRGYRAALGAGEVRRAAPGDAARCGDEPAELARRLGDAIPVFVARDRWRAGEAARAAGATALVLDDACHIYRPQPQFRLVVLDARRPWGSGRVVPAGDLREPASALRDADAVVLTRAAGADTRAVREALHRLAPAALIAEAEHRPAGLVTLDGAPATEIAGRWWLLTGVARPDDVARAARDLSVHIAGHTALADHATLTPRVLDQVEQAAAAQDAGILTTEKDAARLDPHQRARLTRRWCALRVAFVPGEGVDPLLGRMRASLGLGAL